MKFTCCFGIEGQGRKILGKVLHIGNGEVCGAHFLPRNFHLEAHGSLSRNDRLLAENIIGFPPHRGNIFLQLSPTLRLIGPSVKSAKADLAL